MLVFTESFFDEADDGSIIESVSPVDRRREHALVDAKVPSADGTVPLDGPY